MWSGIVIAEFVKRRNSGIFFDNFWYNEVRCKGWIIILAVISEAVRISGTRVRFDIKSNFNLLK